MRPLVATLVVVLVGAARLCAAEVCLGAGGRTDGSDRLVDGADQAVVQVARAAGCRRSYQLSTTARLRDGQPENPRRLKEHADQPRLRTGNDLLDAVYALAIEELREAAVIQIR